MGMPTDIGIIDTMMGTRAGATAKEQNYAFLRQGQLKDAESKNMNFPAQYMFKDVPFSDQARDATGPVDEPLQGADLLLPAMDKWNGADKVIYAGYFPMGLSLDRIMGDMPNVGFKDEVWPKFLRENARKVLKL